MGKAEDNFNFYAVKKGRQPGIYDNWQHAEEQILHFSRNAHKGFDTLQAAEEYMTTGIGKINSNKVQYFIKKPSNSAEQTAKSDTEWSTLAADNTLENRQNLNLDPNSTSTPLKTNHQSPCINCVNYETIINNLIGRIESLEGKIDVLTNQVKPLAQASVADNKLDIIADRLRTVEEQLCKSYSKAVTSNIIAESQIPNRTRQEQTTSNPSTNNKSNATNTTRRTVLFNPEKCVVIENIPESALPSINQDTIRSEICKMFGPTMIDIVNRYKPNSTNPKFIVQFADSNVIDNIVTNWSSLLGTSVRKTIKPNLHIGMAKGVPLSITDEELSTQVNRAFPRSTTYRLKAQGNPLRTVKINFDTEEQLFKACNEGLLIDSNNLLVRIEKPITRSPAVNHHG